MADAPLLHLLRLVSPSLPVGAFAYSQGMEAAVERGLLARESVVADWLSGLLVDSLARLDMPILARQMTALADHDSAVFQRWNDRIIAYRETSELRLESQQMGRALMRLLTDLGIDSPVDCDRPLDWVSAFALAAHQHAISSHDALSGYAWSWCENQIAAAVKLVPLGQTAGQRLLCQLIDAIPAATDLALQVDDQQLGTSATQVAILSCQHENQYSRLFRS